MLQGAKDCLMARKHLFTKQHAISDNCKIQTRIARKKSDLRVYLSQFQLFSEKNISQYSSQNCKFIVTGAVYNKHTKKKKSNSI